MTEVRSVLDCKLGLLENLILFGQIPVTYLVYIFVFFSKILWFNPSVGMGNKFLKDKLFLGNEIICCQYFSNCILHYEVLQNLI